MQVAQSGHPREEDRLGVVIRVGQCCHIPGVSSSRVGRQISRLTFEISKKKKRLACMDEADEMSKKGGAFFKTKTVL